VAGGRVVTTSQTVGPFFRLGLDLLAAGDLTGTGVSGQVIELEGTIFDGAGHPVPDALIETWQADAAGQYPGMTDTEPARLTSGFRGFGRVATDDRGHFRLRTIKPGRVRGPSDTFQAPHLAVAIFMRGLLRHLVTRVYFADEPTTETDVILNMVEPTRRHTLIAQPRAGSDAAFTWDVRLQGPDETVFFEI
jgi:protocatechuate 3,4-dioxygenase, alpha subunit